MLELYRRHTTKCRHREKGRGFTKCNCPIWVDGELNGRRFRRSVGLRNWSRAVKRLELWDPQKDAPIPGWDETETTQFPPSMAEVGYVVDCISGGGTRPAGEPCAGCVSLPPQFIYPDLPDFTSIGQLGFELEDTGWHGSFHCGVSAEGCKDIGNSVNATRDPAFWRAHKKLDAIVRDWQRFKAADIVIVVDTSGSMRRRRSPLRLRILPLS